MTSAEKFGFSESPENDTENAQNEPSLLYKVLKTISIVIVWMAIVSFSISINHRVISTHQEENGQFAISNFLARFSQKSNLKKKVCAEDLACSHRY